MKIILLLISLSLLSNVYAKGQTRYYLNKREISPQSALFLNPKDIDSIKQHINSQSNADTVIVLYTTREDKILTFNELLKHFYIDKSAKNLPVNSLTYTDIEVPEKLVLSNDMVRGVFITRHHPGVKKSIRISSIYLHYDKSSAVERIIDNLIRKFNNIRSNKQ